jgi:endonuclease G
MLNKIFVLFTLLNLNSYSQQKDSVLVATDIYTVSYSEKLEQPLWIKYTVKCPNGTASRTGMDFYTDKGIHTSDAKDYVDNVYDKGHMAPAADFNCTKEMLYKTFSYVNCALQNQYLNRGVWKTLEAQEREWAKSEIVSVTIRVVFTDFNHKLLTGATIPTGFYKTICLQNSKKTYQYYLPNIKPTKTNFTEYEVK